MTKRSSLILSTRWLFFPPDAPVGPTWDFLQQNSLQSPTKGPVVCLGFKPLVCVLPQQVRVPEEELSVRLLASQSTNWVVKAEQLLFGNVVINRVGCILPSTIHCQRNSVLVTELQQCVLQQSVDLEAFLFLHSINVSASSFYLVPVLPLHSSSEDGW